MKEIVRPRQMMMLLHGPPGAGKTSFAVQAPSPALLLDIEGGAYFPIERFKPEGLTAWGELTAGEVSKELLMSKQRGMRSVIVDSVTAWVEMLLPTEPTLDAWGRVTATVRNALRSLRDIPYVVLIAQSNVNEDGTIVPAIPPAILRYIAANSMVIAYVENRQVMVSSTKAITKDRTGQLPKIITWKEVQDVAKL